MRFAILGVVLLASAVSGQQTVVTCPSGQVPTPTVAGQSATVVCVAAPVTPPPPTSPAPTLSVNANPSTGGPGRTVTLTAVTTGGQTPFGYVVTLAGKPVTFTPVTASSGTIVAPSTAGQHLYTVTLTDALNRKASAMVTVTVTITTPPPVDPPPTGLQHWENVTTLELGECSAEAHAQYRRQPSSIGLPDDGYTYQTWHPQQDNTALGKGCVYGHEHGDDPALQQQAWVRANWNPLMGYAARRDSTMPGEPNGHMEPHNGYKVHVTNIGEMNDEGRINQTATTSMPHMGTGGPNRFNVDRHSVQIADWHQNGIHHSKIDAMFSTGTRGNPVVDNTISPNCPTRTAAPTKDGLILGQCAPQDSSYEIWSMLFRALRANGEEFFRKFVTPAVFDPITVHNPANPSETVYYWDARVKPFMRFQNDWSGFRGCAREGYSQVGYHYNGNDPSEEYILDVRTSRVVTAAGPYTTRLVVGRSNTGGNPPFSSNILQFKKRRDHCDFRAKLSLTN